MKFWLIRIGLAFALSMGAGFAVEVIYIGFVVAAFGSLDAFLYRPARQEEFRLYFLGFQSMTGGTVTAMIASILSVLLAPTHYPDRLVLRSWLMATSLGALAGCGTGAVLSLLHPDFLSLDWTFYVVLISGVLVACAAAIGLRFRSKS
jgi:hypothetical protein